MKSLLKEDGIQSYMQEIASHRLLTREEEIALFQRLEGGDEGAREEIIRCNLRLVVKIAMQFRDCSVPLADLIQEGNIGLMTVTRKFDWRRGFRFSTYAAIWIRQEIQAAVRSNSSMIRLPIRKARLMGRISETIRHFASFEGREPSADEIALFLDLEPAKVLAVMPFREAVVSLDAQRNEEGACLLDAVPDAGPAPWAACSDEQTAAAVRSALCLLSDRERDILSLRFGLNDGNPLSLRKTSRVVGLSQEGVRRIERRAIEKLQRPSVLARLDGLAA